MAQILDDLSKYCSDAGVANIFYIIKIFFIILQIVVPAILIISAIMSLTGLMADPDDKKKKKSLLNKVMAAIIVFFIPFIVNIVLSLVANSGDGVTTFDIYDCWANATHTEYTTEKKTTDPSNNMRRRCTPISVDEDGNVKYDEANCIKGTDSNGKEVWYQCPGCGTTTHT